MNRLANGNIERAKALAALILTAKGVPFIYYGDEIGMKNITANTYEEIADIQGKTFYKLAIDAGKTTYEALTEGNNHNRDKSRSPMQWDDSPNAGFTIGKPWIKINDDYRTVNVRNELQNKNSILNTYIALLVLRNKEKTLQYGSYEKLVRDNDMILFTRTFNQDKITVIINFGNEQTVRLPNGAKILMGKTVLDPNDFLIYKTVER
jgi:trehalose-6-phosphate hydrolase